MLNHNGRAVAMGGTYRRCASVVHLRMSNCGKAHVQTRTLRSTRVGIPHDANETNHDSWACVVRGCACARACTNMARMLDSTLAAPLTRVCEVAGARPGKTLCTREKTTTTPKCIAHMDTPSVQKQPRTTSMRGSGSRLALRFNLKLHLRRGVTTDAYTSSTWQIGCAHACAQQAPHINYRSTHTTLAPLCGVLRTRRSRDSRSIAEKKKGSCYDSGSVSAIMFIVINDPNGQADKR
jgi:hypothetical protein